jgi:hypothetical protein
MISPGASLLSGLCVEWCRGSGFGMVAAIFRKNSSAAIDLLSMSWNLTAVKRILKSCCCHSAVMSGGIWPEGFLLRALAHSPDDSGVTAGRCRRTTFPGDSRQSIILNFQSRWGSRRGKGVKRQRWRDFWRTAPGKGKILGKSYYRIQTYNCIAV